MKKIILFLMLLILGCQTNDTQPDVRIITDLPYSLAHQRQKLDLYLPTQKNFPVIFFVPGGGWEEGDKGMYAHVGRYYASRGYGVAICNYRLSPEVSHPAHVRDTAGAFAWVHRHIRQYGGQSNQIYLVGHSAGAHLASLLALDQSYLSEYGLDNNCIRGVVAVSGVYEINVFTNRHRVFHRRDFASASPARYAGNNSPPFLVIYGSQEAWVLKHQAAKFYQHLRNHHCRADLICAAGENHLGTAIDLCNETKPYNRAIQEFFEKSPF